jgi:hypothetical protein
MDLSFEKTIHILRVISAFVRKKNYNMHYFWEKALQKPTFWMNFKDLFFLLNCMVMDDVFGDFVFI